MESTALNTKKSSGGRYCCAKDCHNCQQRDCPRGVKFYLFPQDVERCHLWEKVVNRALRGNSREHWKAGKYDVICSEKPGKRVTIQAISRWRA